MFSLLLWEEETCKQCRQFGARNPEQGCPFSREESTRAAWSTCLAVMVRSAACSAHPGGTHPHAPSLLCQQGQDDGSVTSWSLTQHSEQSTLSKHMSLNRLQGTNTPLDQTHQMRTHEKVCLIQLIVMTRYFLQMAVLLAPNPESSVHSHTFYDCKHYEILIPVQYK